MRTIGSDYGQGPRAFDRPTGIEAVYGIEDHALRAYLLDGAVDELGGADYLRSLAEDMARSDEPIVQYAAGWAAADAALHQYPPHLAAMPAATMEHRHADLEVAGRQWIIGAAALAGARAAGQDKNQATNSYANELRAIRALASLPVMRVVACWSAGHQVSKDIVADATQETNEVLLALGQEVIRPVPVGHPFYTRKLGMARELATALLLPRNQPASFLVIPASMRTVHNSSRNGANLVAVATTAPHDRMPLSFNALSENPDVVQILEKEHLRLVDDVHDRHALQALVDEWQATTAPTMLSEGLDELSDSLIAKIQAR